MAEEGWKNQKNRRRRPAGREITSYFITRFPEAFSISKLWKIFQEFGWVNDVFIPKKKTKGGYVFGFVRFVGVSDVVALEEKLNTVVIEGKRISANISIYGREEVGHGEVVSDRRAGKGGKVEAIRPSPCTSLHVSSPVQPGMSYKNVLLETVSHAPRSVEVEPFITQSSKEWGSNALVGEVKNLEILENLRRNFEAIGLPDVELLFIGGLSVMVVFPASTLASGFLCDRREVWLGWFSKLNSWSGQVLKFQRLAWLSIRGIPLHCWDNFVIDRIGELFGRVVLNPAVSARDNNLSVARICVLVSSGNWVDEQINLKWANSSFSVWVVEDRVDWCPNFGSKVQASVEDGDEDDDLSVGFDGSESDSSRDFEEDDFEQPPVLESPVLNAKSPESENLFTGATLPEVDEESRGEKFSGEPSCMGNMSECFSKSAQYKVLVESMGLAANVPVVGERMAESERNDEAVSVSFPLLVDGGTPSINNPVQELKAIHAGLEISPTLGLAQVPLDSNKFGDGVSNHKGLDQGCAFSPEPSLGSANQRKLDFRGDKKKTDLDPPKSYHTIAKPKSLRKGPSHSLKMKDVLWVPKVKHISKIGEGKGKGPTKAETLADDKGEASSCSEDNELQGTIMVGGMVGFRMGNQAEKVNRMIMGEGVNSMSR
ncbi:hypothetical protein QVD17_08900 [Tagetes erecta]|uniref:RRM domain-containing protein n=1 Tax=Tagetes erecta TaxID=13708 RepID=A0AAD8L2V8_TARER|nr:hypothetical protein QVD17_08900 [Tagetes erecta]